MNGTKKKKYRFDRMEFAGSFGDLGTLLPLALGMILINGLRPGGIFLAIGFYYIASGLYFQTTVPVQPMKVISAYAISTGMSASQILASGLLIGIFLMLIGITGAVALIEKYTPKPVIRGVQLSTGVLLMAQGVKFMLGSSKFQMMKNVAEPFLSIQTIGPVPIGIVIGVIGGFFTLYFLDNRRFPAGLLLVLGGMVIGGALGAFKGLEKLNIGLFLPEILPAGWPTISDFSAALLILVLPQIPMTIGNAAIAYVDLSDNYFGEKAKKVTCKSACLSMAIANFASFLIGGIPLCHGAGGLAAHYRFGARTAGSNIMIGSIFVILALLFGSYALYILYLIPMSILGILLVFAGVQLGLAVIDLKERKDFFVVLAILGITLSSNLASGFLAGIAIAYALKSEKLNV